MQLLFMQQFPVPPAKYSEPQSHEKYSERAVKYMHKKTYLSFVFITSRPMRQIKQRD